MLVLRVPINSLATAFPLRRTSSKLQVGGRWSLLTDCDLAFGLCAKHKHCSQYCGYVHVLNVLIITFLIWYYFFVCPCTIPSIALVIRRPAGLQGNVTHSVVVLYRVPATAGPGDVARLARVQSMYFSHWHLWGTWTKVHDAAFSLYLFTYFVSPPFLLFSFYFCDFIGWDFCTHSDDSVLSCPVTSVMGFFPPFLLTLPLCLPPHI